MSGSDASWIAVAMSALALGGTAANGLIGWLKDRDKYRFDINTAVQKVETANAVKLAQLDAKVNGLSEDLADCKQQHADAKAEVATLREQVNRKFTAVVTEMRTGGPGGGPDLNKPLGGGDAK